MIPLVPAFGAAAILVSGRRGRYRLPGFFVDVPVGIEAAGHQGARVIVAKNRDEALVSPVQPFTSGVRLASIGQQTGVQLHGFGPGKVVHEVRFGPSAEDAAGQSECFVRFPGSGQCQRLGTDSQIVLWVGCAVDGFQVRPSRVGLSIGNSNALSLHRTGQSAAGQGSVCPCCGRR